MVVMKVLLLEFASCLGSESFDKRKTIRFLFFIRIIEFTWWIFGFRIGGNANVLLVGIFVANYVVI